jgi:undecaprenyl pyrophosphate phosphatase UppP
LANPTLIIYMIIAFLFGFIAAAFFIRWLISLDHRHDDPGALPEDHYPDMRRALHYIRQEIFGILGAMITIAGLLAAIVVALIARR